MSDKKARTLAELARLGVRSVGITCEDCHHTEVVDLRDLMSMMYGLDERQDGLPYRCKCGSAKVYTRPHPETETGDDRHDA